MYTDQNFGLIQCKVCNKIFEEPRLLDCLHSFCCTCLQSHIDSNTRPSDESVTCPLCTETSQHRNSAKDFPRNVLLEKLIAQAQKDTTTVVAEREVEKMTYEALSADDLQCPDVLATVQQVASVAGHVIADNVKTHEQVYDSLLVKKKRGLHLKSGQLQVRAMDLVQSIDKVNNALQDWTDSKTSVREMIKQRSREMQEQVRSIERKLLADLDDKYKEESVRDDAFGVKNSLHKTLRSSLSMVDFLRLLMEYGESDDVDLYSEMIRNREQRLYSGPVVLERNTFQFECQENETGKGLEDMFGKVVEVSESIVVWDPNRPTYKADTAVSNGNNRRESDQERIIDDQGNVLAENMTNQALNIENNGEEADPGSVQSYNDYSGTSWRQFNRPTSRGNRRGLPTKSISFDSSLTNGRHYATNGNQELYDNMLYGGTRGENTTEFEILNENETSNNRCVNNNNVKRNLNRKDSFKSAIDALVSSSKVIHHYGGQRSRRDSAPPSMMIDSLNRRRLNALSILERSNICTDGFQMTTDVESGMNEARQEWLRENLQRKLHRSTSIQETV